MLAAFATATAAHAATTAPTTTSTVTLTTTTTVTLTTTSTTTTYGFTTTAAPTTTETARLTDDQATKIFLADGKVRNWLKRYPPKPVTDASYANGQWTVNVFYGAAGEIATGTVDDVTGAILSAWTGPQVAWGMARGGPGAFGGTKINSYSVWLSFCAAFLIGLIDWRRPLSLRTVDLLMMLSFSVSLWFFNRGNIFAAMPFAYPGMVWLLLRCVWTGIKDRGPRGSVVWPAWLLVAATVFLVGFRIGLNVENSNVIDVGLSGVIGADRIAHGQSPYGNFPIEGNRPDCGPADANGEVRDRIQTNGRCEAADAQGDTYGPVAYEAYLPAYAWYGWSGKWDKLWTAHATSIAWDILAIIGLWFVGRRFGGPRLGAALAFAWAAWPFSQYSSSSNTNDMIQPALLVWGFWLVTSPYARGAFGALGALTKFSGLIVLPLWSGYPDARDNRSRLKFLAGLIVAAAAAFSVMLFERSPIHNAVIFFHHTFGYQLGRSSPFSLWDWRQYHAKGLPDLHWVQQLLEVLLVVGALALYRWPRHRSPLQLAAFTGALLVGFEMILTHWSWLYLEWFFPFVAFALISPRPAESPVEQEVAAAEEPPPPPPPLTAVSSPAI